MPEDAERRLILATLERLGGDKKRAAKILGASKSRSTNCPTLI